MPAFQRQPVQPVQLQPEHLRRYLSYTYSLPKSYTLKAGARYEYTTINANFVNSDTPVEIPSYGVLVPSVNLSKKLKNGNTLKLAYNRRIQRPSLQFLNPNIQASNPLNETVGNPDLQPEFTNNFELGYSTFIKGTSLSLSTFVRNTNNSIGPIRSAGFNNEGAHGHPHHLPEPGPGRRLRLQYLYQRQHFQQVHAQRRHGRVLRGAQQQRSQPRVTATNQGWVYNMRAFGNYTLGQGWGLQLFGFYRGRQVQLQGCRAASASTA
jgi:outer membrane receptor protein involved in Fe transport